jgi:hypothetical protein
MTVNLARLIFFDYFQNGHITGALAELIPLDPSADQGNDQLKTGTMPGGANRVRRPPAEV